jgi:chemosensory pili system protein ChpA (sensor histidine kinase/response regulator)
VAGDVTDASDASDSGDVAVTPSDASDEKRGFAATIDTEIYEIFVEEVNEILDNFRVWIPQWSAERDNTELLRDIRRAYHTCKGSGRMVGGLAMGDYAWVHEDMLNQVLEGRLARNDDLAALLQQSSDYLHAHREFFLTADHIDDAGRREIERVEAFISQPVTSQPAVSDDVSPLSADPVDESPAFLMPLVVADMPAAELVADETPAEAEQLPVEEIPAAESVTADVADSGSPASAESEEPASGPVTFSVADEQEEQRIVWSMFKEELPDQLLNIDQQMQNLIAEPEDMATLQELERELHTLKGSSRMAQLMDMGDAAHQAEELLEQVRRERGRVISEAELNELQVCIDRIGSLAEQYSLGGMPMAAMAEADSETETGTDNKPPPDQAEGAALLKPAVKNETAYESYLEQILSEQADSLPDLSVLETIDAFTDEHLPPQDSPSAPLTLADQEQVRLSAISLDQMVGSSNALNIQQNTLRERLVLMGEDVGEFGRTTARLRQLLRSLELETETQIHAGYRQHSGHKPQHGAFDPLEMDEYSEIQRLSRALAESLNDLINIEGDLALQLRTVEKFAHESLQTSRELHQSLLSTRLIEVAVIVPRLRRIMRQVAAEFGRTVTFEVDGESLKLDRYLLQRITAPIEHILRNAVFHGIEPPDERQLQGKAKDGGVLLEVRREDSEVVIRISDDGRGLDKDKILAKAVESGLVAASASLSDQDIYKLVLNSGFTTVAEANQVAGRGVGMDIVNSEIKALGGSLLIDSVPGAGCEFTLRLPFTMVANPVLFVDVQKQHYALPLSGIQGLTRLSSELIRQHLANSDSPLLFNGQPYALHYLGGALGHRGQPELRAGEMHVVVYMRLGEYQVAWLVDAINGRRDVVLQSLGALFKTCRFYSAATVTSDGEVVMVPDMLELTTRIMNAAEEDKQAPAPESADSAQVGAVIRHEHPHILVVDDSITVRKVTEKLLLNKNFVVETAKDGLEALEKLGAFAADLVLLDIEMPRMDGFEVLSAVRMEKRWQDLPVIMISSRTAEKHLEHAKALGATDFLGKPYQNHTLLEHINKYLHKTPDRATAETQTDEELAL